MFCDDIVVPSELASAYQPTPLRIAANYQANDSKRTIGHATTKQGSGLPEDKFAFCCFSNYYKITEEVFDAWMTILARSGDSVIWLNDDNASARGNMLARAAEHREAKELGIRRGQPILVRRVTFLTQKNEPVITGRSIYRADRVSYRLTVST